MKLARHPSAQDSNGGSCPSVSVVIPARPGQEEVPAVAAAARLRHPSDRIEVLVARGRQPAVQRNAALREARGEWVYFLDDDSVPDPDNLDRARARMAEAGVVVVGGPNVCPPGVPRLERVFAVVLASWLATGPSRARYDRVGRPRVSGEKELILCNLLARRQGVLEAGGFDEGLYPNEENALMDELQRRGGQLVYDPDFLVQRRPRATRGAFARMMFTYGRGRAEQFRRHPTPGSIMNFVPPLFCLYLLIGPWWGWAGLAPLALYGAVVLGQTAVSVARHGFGDSLSALPWVVLTHLLYGAGFFRGLTTRLAKGSVSKSGSGSGAGAGTIEVSIERVGPALGREEVAS